ncbi:MAG: MerR family transcriptional regulator [Rhizobiales bacterium]|nr:MerR family transcriptional regulator [Hyphomicrobiales bacterium]
MEKSPDAFRTISEVAEELDVPQHVLRFWETRFVQIKPLKRGGGRRYYRPEDIELLRAIRRLLYGEGYTIRGVQRILKEQGPKAVAAMARGGALPKLRPPAESDDEADDDPGADFVAGIEGEAPGAPSNHTAPPALSAPAQPELFAAPRPPGLEPHVRADIEAALRELAECERILIAARQA